MRKKIQRGFTIVELLVVIVIIAILAAVSYIAYSGISQKAKEVSLQSDLASSSKLLKLYQVEYGNYPNLDPNTNCPMVPSIVDNKYCLKASSNNSYQGGYSFNNSTSPQTFSLVAVNGNTGYKVTESTSPSPYNVTVIPLNLVATASSPNIGLTWSAPPDNGGSAITNYKIYRGTTSGGETLLTTLGNVLNYTDSSPAAGRNYYRITAVNGSGEGGYSNEADAIIAIAATGGTIVDGGGYRTHTFTSSGTFSITSGGNVEVLVVAGGGGGGTLANSWHKGGGGGAGGLLYNASYTVTNGSMAVTIGNGGAASTSGQNSVFGTMTAIGGGKGGDGPNQSGLVGGSGGGAMGSGYTSNLTVVGSSGTAGQGNSGGSGRMTTDQSVNCGAGGGGGGANSSGSSFSSDCVAGAGGAGKLYFGNYYAGGGGGAGGTGGSGGVGGGGGGGNSSVAAGTAGVANTGGGGGGGKGVAGGAGGSGVVIIRYPY